MKNNVLDKKIILGSASPRRKEILERAGFQVEVRKLNVDESYPHSIEKNTVSEYLSKKKHAALATQAEEIGITADTIVLLDEQILEKPKDEKEANEILRKLSGSRHQVITGITISKEKKSFSFREESTVFFKELSQDEITHYVQHYNPYDKAGAYGIQDWIGMIGIIKIEGCYYNVMGLPIHAVYQKLQDLNF